MIGRILGGCGSDGGFVVKTIQIAACLLKVLYPLLRLVVRDSSAACPAAEIGSGMQRERYLGDHHMAIESALAARCTRPLDMGPNFGDDGSAKGHVGDKVAIHLAGVSAPASKQGRMRALVYNVNVKP